MRAPIGSFSGDERNREPEPYPMRGGRRWRLFRAEADARARGNDPVGFLCRHDGRAARRVAGCRARPDDVEVRSFDGTDGVGQGHADHVRDSDRRVMRHVGTVGRQFPDPRRRRGRWRLACRASTAASGERDRCHDEDAEQRRAEAHRSIMTLGVVRFNGDASDHKIDASPRHRVALVRHARTDCPVGARYATVNDAQIRDTRERQLKCA